MIRPIVTGKQKVLFDEAFQWYKDNDYTYATLIRPLVIADANTGLTEGQLQIKYDVSRAAIRWILR